MSESKGVVYRLIAFNQQTGAEVVVGYGSLDELCELSRHPERTKVERFNQYFDRMIAGFKLCGDNPSLVHEEEKSGD